MQFARAGRGVEQDQVFVERACLGGYAAVRHHGQAAAVEYQTVIPAHLVDVDNGAAMSLCQGTQHVYAQGAFFDRVGRAGNVDEECGSLPD